MSRNTIALTIKVRAVKGCYRLVLWSIIFFPALFYGQAATDVDPSIKNAIENMAPVQVDGNILFYVRGVMSYTAEIRAKTIQKRIYQAAENRAFPADSIKAIPAPDRIQIYAGTAFIMNIYDVDAEVDGISKELQAEIVVEKIKSALRQYWQERNPSTVKANVLHALVATALLIASLFVFIWIFRRLNEAFKRRIQTKVEKLENVSFKLIQSNQLLKVLHVAYSIIRIIIVSVIVISFFDYILSLFPWTKGLSVYILDLILDPIKNILNGFLDYLPSLIFLIVIFLVTQYIVKLTKLLFDGLSDGGIIINNFDPEWAIPTFKIAKFFIIVFAIVVAFPYIPGSSTGAFQGISVFLGVLFSLGSSSFISNVVAGYSMTYRRAFKKGDRIQVNDMNGFVEEQSLMVTRLRSVKNEEIVIPNSIMLNSNVINFSARAKQQGLILHTTVGIGYETPWRQVDAMLKLAADRTEGLLKDPPPFVLKRELGDFCVTYEINAYCQDVVSMFKYYTEIHEHILDIFNENNVQIMTPAYEGDPDTPKVVPKEQWNAPLANGNPV